MDGKYYRARGGLRTTAQFLNIKCLSLLADPWGNLGKAKAKNIRKGDATSIAEAAEVEAQEDENEEEEEVDIG